MIELLHGLADVFVSKEGKKKYIADTATVVFGEKWFWPSSLQDIAQKANISKAGLYHYFNRYDYDHFSCHVHLY